jgi:hypothetical protein
VVGTVEHCTLIADGCARDAPFAAAPVGELPAAIARYLRERRAAAANGPSHGADHA